MSTLRTTPSRRSLFFSPLGPATPSLVDYGFGGTVGAREWVKDKLFFFASYEGDRLRQAAGSFCARSPLLKWSRVFSPRHIHSKF